MYKNKELEKAHRHDWYMKNREQCLQKSREWWQKNKERFNQRRTERRLENRELYRQRDKELYWKNRERRRQTFKESYWRNREYYLQRDREWRERNWEQIRAFRRELKLDVFSHYSEGLRCARCGFKDLRALSIDHINEDGNERRMLEGHGSNMHGWLKRHGYPEGYQVLCMNCQWIKHREYVKAQRAERHSV